MMSALGPVPSNPVWWFSVPPWPQAVFPTSLVMRPQLNPEGSQDGLSVHFSSRTVLSAPSPQLGSWGVSLDSPSWAPAWQRASISGLGQCWTCCICSLTLRGYCSLWPDVQCLKNNGFMYCFSSVCGGRRGGGIKYGICYFILIRTLCLLNTFI